MSNLLSFGLNILADVFYPKYCFGCRRSGRYLCKFCVTQLTFSAQHFCIVCNTPNAQGKTHAQCCNSLTPDRLLSAFPYQQSVISEMIISGKYFFISSVYSLLGILTAQWLIRTQISVDLLKQKGFVLCPIPLHPQRQRWRGFNQSQIIAQTISEQFKLPYADLLIRRKNTKTQKDLDAKARQTNMQNAFTCSARVPENIILVDDVTTTGQTFLEATKVLKQNGAKTVWCLSVAKD
jgi:competence protein ComFC